jgi:hypothetical protein
LARASDVCDGRRTDRDAAAETPPQRAADPPPQFEPVLTLGEALSRFFTPPRLPALQVRLSDAAESENSNVKSQK